jgi:hypothetical protein
MIGAGELVVVTGELVGVAAVIVNDLVTGSAARKASEAPAVATTVQVPAVVNVTVATVESKAQFPETRNDTSRPEEAFAIRATEPGADWAAICANVITCPCLTEPIAEGSEATDSSLEPITLVARTLTVYVPAARSVKLAILTPAARTLSET